MNVRNVEFLGIFFEEYNYEYFKDNDPILSVYCITYNHSQYIKDCIEGFVKQKTDFVYEIVIFDDASNDGTSDIIREYSRIYPKKIHAFIAKQNSYHYPCRGELSRLVRKVCLKGKYVAFCEGDDYWLDDDKLQLQIDFLLRHPEFSLTIHNAIKLNSVSNSQSNMVDIECDRILNTHELIMQQAGSFPFCSFVGRKELFTDSFCLFTNIVQDWPLQLYASSIGKVYFFSKTKAVYRYLTNNSWTFRTNLNMRARLLNVFNLLDMLNRFNKLTDFKFETTLVDKQNILWATIVDILLLKTKDLSLLINEIKLNTNTSLDIDYYLCQLFSKVKIVTTNKCVEHGTDFAKLYHLYASMPVLIYCASTAGERILRIFRQLGIDVQGFVDSDNSKDGSFFCGIRVLGANKLAELNLCDYVIQVASLDFDTQIIKRLKSLKSCNYVSAHDFYISYLK